MPTPPYALVTAARNEGRFIELTIQSVIAQTVLPVRWVIVSDGSTDETDAIVQKYLDDHDWIEFVRLTERSPRNFAGKVAAFNAGYARLAGLAYQVIGNLDADVSFPPDYLGFLVSRFAEDPRLGVAGTPYREDGMMQDERFKSPSHVSGACQLFRRECFEAIGGYPAVASGGVDFIALLKAQAAGWRTRRFEEKWCRHHKSVGSGMHGQVWRRLLNNGRKDYLLGSHPVFEVFRAILQMKRRPYVIGGSLVLAGYLTALLRGAERSLPGELVALRQRDQLDRLRKVLLHPLRYRRGLVPVAQRAIRTSD